MGPVASQEAIKQLGTNGGGFFNANTAHPFENPTPLTNFVEMLSIFAIPAALTYTYGRMARDQRQGWALFAAMALLFFAGVTAAYWAETQRQPGARAARRRSEPRATWRARRSRFGVARLGAVRDGRRPTPRAARSTRCTTASRRSAASCRSSNIQLGEVVFGGVGAGLYGDPRLSSCSSVFIAGLMVGRTPEYLGKKIEAREMKLAMLYVLIFPLIILGFAAWARSRRTASRR